MWSLLTWGLVDVSSFERCLRRSAVFTYVVYTCMCIYTCEVFIQCIYVYVQ